MAFVTGDQLRIGDGNGDRQVYLTPRRRAAGLPALERASTGPGGRPGNRSSVAPRLSADGRFAVFESLASNLVPDDTDFASDVLLYDRLSGSLELVSERTARGAGRAVSAAPAISADGGTVAFESTAPDIAPDDIDAVRDVLVLDRGTGDIRRASVGVGGAAPDGDSRAPDLSADGRFVAFTSAASNLVADDTDRRPDAFVRDLVAGTTERVSTTASGGQGGAGSSLVAISGDGSRAAFAAKGSGLVPGASGTEIYVKARAGGDLVALGIDAVATSARYRVDTLDVDFDGCTVAFDLVPLTDDGFVAGPGRAWTRDCADGRFTAAGEPAPGAAPRESSAPAIDAAGRNLVFLTADAAAANAAANAEPEDGNGLADVVLADRGEPCDAGPVTVRRGDWHMLSLPCEPPPDADRVVEVFDELGPGLRSAWTVFTFDPLTGRYVEADADTHLVPGVGFWFIQNVEDEVSLALPEGGNRVPRDTISEACERCGRLHRPAPERGAVAHALEPRRQPLRCRVRGRRRPGHRRERALRRRRRLLARRGGRRRGRRPGVRHALSLGPGAARLRRAERTRRARALERGLAGRARRRAGQPAGGAPAVRRRRLAFRPTWRVSHARPGARRGRARRAIVAR